MKRKYLNKTISILLVTTMLSGLTGCSELSQNHNAEESVESELEEPTDELINKSTNEDIEFSSAENEIDAQEEVFLTEEVSEETNDSYLEAAVINDLSIEEMDYFNTWCGESSNYGFLMSEYDDVRYVVMYNVEYCFEGGIDELNLSEKEINKMTADYYGDGGEIDVTCYTTKAMDEYLTKIAGITTRDLKYYDKPENKKYNIHMFRHGDTNWIPIKCVGGTIGGDIYTVHFIEDTKSNSSSPMYETLTKFKKVGDEFILLSNQLLLCPTFSWANNGMKPEDFIFPHSDDSYISEKMLEGKTAEECRIARNEIYARAGYIFKDDSLTEYFSRYDWYEPRYTADEFEQNVYCFDEERVNIEMIKSYEKKMGY